MIACHNGTAGCAFGLDPSPLCAPCQAQMEIGVWWQREGAARELGYKVSCEATASQAQVYLSAIRAALDAATWDAARAALRPFVPTKLAG